MNDTLNHFRAGVIAERQFARAVAKSFGAEQWHARCEHLAERIFAPGDPVDYDDAAERFGRLSVALFALEDQYLKTVGDSSS